MALNEKDRKWIEEKFDALTSQVIKSQIAIAELKVKSGIWGVIGGVATVAVALGIYITCRN
jgi:hypothetical protein